MAWIEVPEKRLQKSKTFYDASTHQFQAVLTIHDQHFKDEVDTWQDIDENLVDDITDGFNKACNKTRHIFRVASGGNRRWYPRRNVLTEYMDITNIQFWRTTGGGSWRNINLPTPVWTNQGGDWDMPNLHATLINTWKQIKAEFILKDTTAPTRLRFAVSFVGLTYNPTTGELTSTTDGLVWGMIEPPKGWYGDPLESNGTSIPVIASYDGSYIEWNADTTGATFPVYVDPTFTDGYGGDVTTAKDTQVLQGQPTTNFGAGFALNLFGSQGTFTDGNALLGFNLASISVNATCDSATLYNYKRSILDTYTITVYPMHADNAGWTETGACWNYRTGTTPWAGGNTGCRTAGTDYINTSLGSFSGANADAYDAEYTASLTTSVVEAAFGGAFNIVEFITAGNLWSSCVLQSSDQTNTAARPKLVVVYTESGQEIEETATHAKFAGITPADQINTNEIAATIPDLRGLTIVNNTIIEEEIYYE